MTRNLVRLAAVTLASLAGSAAIAQPVTLTVSSGTTGRVARPNEANA